MRRATLALVLSAAPSLAAAQLVTGAGAGSHVKAFDLATGATTASFFAYTPSFTGGVRVAVGDVNGDGVADIVTGAGPGAAGGHVKVFDGATGAEVRSFFAYAAFDGGVFVGSGDVDGDGRADLVTGTDEGAPGHVKVFSGLTGAEIRSFLPYASGFSGGVRVAAGDVNGDGLADIVTGTGAGASGGHVKVFDGATGLEIRSFLAYSGFNGGVYVAAGDVNGDGVDDVITGAGEGAVGGHVKVFDGATGAEIRSFLAFDRGFGGGVRVGATRVDGDLFADILVGAGPGGGPHVKVFSGGSLAELASFDAYDPAFTGGVFVAGAAVRAVPEPATLSLLALGGVALAIRWRRRSDRPAADRAR